MSERNVTICLKFGDTTCATKPGEFCRFFGAKRFGQQPWCLLYDSKVYSVEYGDKEGWAKRCHECMEEFPSIEAEVECSNK